ncbi:unnamed protein product [Rangifer tarandus platyrhynchus]|uniref:Uncharacterized protein n=1 Tax=Rangifer tarandus platyrhynchus TaxID=3082113 RepID=A0AC59YAL4_RANTA
MASGVWGIYFMLGLSAGTDFPPSGGAREASHFPQRIAAPVLGDHDPPLAFLFLPWRMFLLPSLLGLELSQLLRLASRIPPHHRGLMAFAIQWSYAYVVCSSPCAEK